MKKPLILRTVYGPECRVVVKRSTYNGNGSLAVILFDSNTNEEVITITVNLDFSLPVCMYPDDEVYQYVNQNHWEQYGFEGTAVEWLKENGFGTYIEGHGDRSGFCFYPLFQFSKSVLNEMEKL